VRLGESYVDRLDGGKRKARDDTEHNSWVFLFQEAVEELEEELLIIRFWYFFWWRRSWRRTC